MRQRHPDLTAPLLDPAGLAIPERFSIERWYLECPEFKRGRNSTGGHRGTDECEDTAIRNSPGRLGGTLTLRRYPTDKRQNHGQSEKAKDHAQTRQHP